MENAAKFRATIAAGRVALGTGISFTDPTVTEALAGLLDFVWIDMEHAPLSVETVQAHAMATRGSAAAPLVRVPWNDLVQIKRVLDVGAAGVIVPLVRGADDVARAVAACRYPPEGVRGYGPRRPGDYGRSGGPVFCRMANATVLAIAQIEHIDAVNAIDAILAVPGLDSIVIGPYDLSGSMGHMGSPDHPDVQRAIDTVLSRARRTGVLAGVAAAADAEAVLGWVRRGAQWVDLATDFALLLKAAGQVVGEVRKQLGG